MLGDQRARLQFSGRCHIAQFEPIGDQPTMALKGKLDISGLIGQSQQLRCDVQPLIESVRFPDHEPPSVEGKAQCGAIVDPARQRDGFPDQRIGSRPLGRPVQLHRQPGKYLGSKPALRYPGG